MHRLPLLFRRAGLVLLPVIITACGFVAPLHEKTVVITVDHLPDRALVVTTSNGKIQARRATLAAVEVTAAIRALTEERLQQVRVEVKRDNAGTLVVRALWPGDTRKSREGCDFLIATPGARGVELRSSDGSLKAVGLSGEARLETSNGGVTVEDHAGPVQADTSNGSIKVRALAGDLRAETGNGRIEASGITGAVRADTSNGSVEIDLAPEGSGPLEIESSNGSITLTLSQAFTGSLDLRTSNGSLHIDDTLEDRVVDGAGKKNVRLQFGNDGPDSRATTSNGSIHVKGRF